MTRWKQVGAARGLLGACCACCAVWPGLLGAWAPLPAALLAPPRTDTRAHPNLKPNPKHASSPFWSCAVPQDPFSCGAYSYVPPHGRKRYFQYMSHPGPSRGCLRCCVLAGAACLCAELSCGAPQPGAPAAAALPLCLTPSRPLSLPAAAVTGDAKVDAKQQAQEGRHIMLQASLWRGGRPAAGAFLKHARFGLHCSCMRGHAGGAGAVSCNCSCLCFFIHSSFIIQNIRT